MRPAMLLRLDQGNNPDRGLDDQTVGEPTTDDDSSLRCRNCGLVVTKDANRISVNGRHDHVFFNPHGHVFEIGCFGNAPGAMPLGPSSAEFSWFSECTWQIAVCSRCRSHLGWLFAGPNGLFFALILDQLAKDG
ncbi:cereblon family protein [Desulfonatronum thiosulfatophilum]|uniref:cereblon family protein n=1 Tax=Desulfonatronum thiosulfatophilum TaxID=617002 RepID=UPI00137A2BBC|nr:cereblon family protein [Desulfonatronum thiosulfatophilum]